MNLLLQEVRFKELNSWSIHLLINSKLIYTDNYPIVYFKEFARKANIEKVYIEDTFKYKILGVRSYGLGVYLNREVFGSTLKMRTYQKAKKNHLFWCKVDTKNGAFGIINEELQNGIGSSNMTFSELDLDKINVDYLQLFFKSKKFHKYLDGLVVGTTNRKYIKFDNLLNDVKIPLPSLKKQKEIVESYQNRINLAISQEKRAIELDKSIEDYLYQELGISLQEKNQKDLLSFVNLKNIDRWDTAYLLDSISMSSNYPLIKIDTVINTFLKDLDNKSLRMEPKKSPKKEFLYIGMENIEKESGNLLGFQEVQGLDIKSQTIKLPKNFFLYGKLRPYLNKYYFNKFDYENIIVSSEFFVFSVKDVDEEYFKFILSSSFIQKQIENHMKGARMPRISEGTFRNLQISLPPLEIQNKIATHIQTLKDEIKELKGKAEQNRNLALSEFEERIFSEN